MFNHLMMLADEAAARAALAAYGSEAGGAWRWDLSVVIPGQRVVLARAVWAADGEEAVEVTLEQVLPGYFLTVSAPGIVPELRDLAGGACRLIGNAVTGELVHVAAGVDTAMLATAIVEPVPAGSSYRLGG